MLVVDDELPLRRAMQSWLGRRGCEVHAARSVSSARKCMKRFPFAGAFIDVWMAMETGLDLYDWMLTAYPGVAANVVFLTGDILPTPERRARLERTGRPILHKPFDLNELDRYVSQWPRPTGRTSGLSATSEPRASA